MSSDITKGGSKDSAGKLSLPGGARLSLPGTDGIAITDSVKQAAMVSRRSVSLVKRGEVDRGFPRDQQGSHSPGGLTEQERESRSAALHRARMSVPTLSPEADKVLVPGSIVARPLAQEDDKQKLPARATGKKSVVKEENVADQGTRNKEFKAKRRRILDDVGDRYSNDGISEDDERKTSARRRKSSRTSPRVSNKSTTRNIIITGSMAVQDLAGKLAIKQDTVMRAMRGCGLDPSAPMQPDEVAFVVSELGVQFEMRLDTDMLKIFDFDRNAGVTRPPVVTVMGHVDHGKTSLLDAIRHSDVVSGEAGGITQHIGAYQVNTSNGRLVTFIDTPGHEAFTKMRSRGAKSTDIVVLVVAADDGVMPQTAEAIRHAKSADVPIIVAINKIDKPGADTARVMRDLAQYDVLVEEMSGEVVCVEVSATKRLNLDKLEEAILVVADMLELKAEVDGYAKGVVLESKLDKARGVVVTLLTQSGSINRGDIILAGTNYCRVRHMVDYRGNPTEQTEPSMPVEILGFDTMPQAGDRFVTVRSEQEAKNVITVLRSTESLSTAKSVVADFASLFSQNKAKEANFIIKADTNGSAQAISDKLAEIRNDELTVKVVHSGVGKVTESDVVLAGVSSATILVFGLSVDASILRLAQGKGVEVMPYNVIYHLLDDVRARLSQMLSPVIKESVIASAVVKQVFDLSSFGKIAGCGVTQGLLKRNASVRLRRGGIVIYTGKINTLKHYKDNVGEVKVGMECGIAFDRWTDIEEGDVIDAYEITKEGRKL